MRTPRFRIIELSQDKAVLILSLASRSSRGIQYLSFTIPKVVSDTSGLADTKTIKLIITKEKKGLLSKFRLRK